MSGSTDAGGPPTSDNSGKQFLVVGVGGSAGAITSFRDFFRNVPPDSGMAYVVILHLSPDHESRLAEVLQASSRIPVRQVRESMAIEPNHVYVIPPNKSLEMSDGTLILSNVTSFEERRAPIDIFFRTLAEHLDSRAVCVVMSGSGSDGTIGLRRIKEYNGLVLVQDPAEAAFGEMPRNCLATGLVDYVLPAAEMPERILHFASQIQTLHVPDETADRAEDDEQALMEIFTILRLRTGHDFINYKRATVLRRLARRMAVRDVETLSAYAALLRGRHDEAHALLAELLISVTNFFRDRDVWDKVEKLVIPRILAARRPDGHIRVWVPGCATGEEAYTISMLLAERGTSDVQIFATDLDEQAIARARDGWYSETEVADITPERLRRFFLKDGDGYRVRRELRETVLFAHHNLIKDPPFSHLDFISCRNLLIYLNAAAQRRAVEVMHFALEAGGYLLLGTAEAVDATPNLFSLVDKEAHLYQSRALDRAAIMAPLPRSVAPVDVHAALARAAETSASEPRTRERFAPIDLHHRLLEEYAAPSIVVDEQYDVVHLSERAGVYLQFPRGEATSNVLQLIRQELRIDLRSALFQAAQKRTSVAARSLSVHTGEREERIDLVVRPALSSEEPARGFFLILFEEATRRDDVPLHEPAAVEPGTRQLEEELLRVRTQMRATIEQYEIQAEESKATNEELQAMNEELRSTAEELETSQEELQSVNEELQTVNQELKVKIDEISHASDDLRNLMSSTDIGTIFVDRAFAVKLFTPRAREVFNLIPADVGRPLSDITHKLVVDSLTAEMSRVLDTLQPTEREVTTRDGAWYLMRLLPYRTSEDRIDGIVLTLHDVTERHGAEEAVRESEARLHAIANLVPDLLWMSDAAGTTTWYNERWGAYTGQAPDVKPGWEWLDVIHPDERGEIAALYRKAVEEGRPLQHENRIRNAGGEYRWFLINAVPARDRAGRVVRYYGTATDVHEQRMAREQLEGRVRDRTRELLDLTVNRQQLLERVVTATEEERQRIARELHDEMGQHITALRVGLEALHPQDRHVEGLRNIIGQIDQSIDRLTLELRPVALDQLGLHGAISSLADVFSAASGIRVAVHFGIEDSARFADAVESTIYRVLQESLTNVWKHAGAKTVSVILERERDVLRLIVEDDGRGFDTSAAAAGTAPRGRFGLLGMRERLALVKGTLDVESDPGRGTTLYVRVPVDPENLA